MTRWFATIMLIILTGGTALAGAVRVSADVGAAAADSTVLVWTFDLADGWHLYGPHRNDTGQPPTVALDLPEGWSAAPLVGWPRPARHVVADLILDYIYEDRLVLRQTLHHPTDAAPGAVTASIRWLVCSDLCVPGDTTLVMTLPSPASAPAAAALSVHSAAAIPPLPEGLVHIERRADGLAFLVPGARRLEFVPDAEGPALTDLLHDGVADGPLLRMRMPPDDPGPSPLTGLLIIDHNDRQVVGRINVDRSTPGD